MTAEARSTDRGGKVRVKHSGGHETRASRPSQSAAFRVDGLPPGEYWIAAVDRVDGTPGGGEWQDAEFLQTLVTRATRMTLGDGQSQALTVRLINR